jgi:secondary thiamine-phosphate synthase enzyme
MATYGPFGLIRHDGVMETTVLRVDTSARWLADLTADAAAFCRDRGDGLLHVFVPHATAGVALIELGSGTEDDLAELLDRVLPRDDRYRHAHGARGHGADHVLPAIISPSMVLPVVGGRLALGTWQSLVLVDTNGDNPERQVRLSFVPA